MGEVIRKVNRAGRFIGWYIRYVDSDGKRKAKATRAATAAEARRILIELEAQAGRRQLGVPERPQPMKGTDLIARWLDEQGQDVQLHMHPEVLPAEVDLSTRLHEKLAQRQSFIDSKPA